MPFYRVVVRGWWSTTYEFDAQDRDEAQAMLDELMEREEKGEPPPFELRPVGARGVNGSELMEFVTERP